MGGAGPTGPQGRNSLLLVSPESPGSNCFHGGTKVEAGLDDDGNGTLEPEEVDSTSYVCASGAGLVFGDVQYSHVVWTNGTYGIQGLKYWAASVSAGVWTIEWPVVYVDDATWVGDGEPTNGHWHGLHSGCGNSNGVATCTAVCEALDMTYVEVNTGCMISYPTTNMNADGRNIYMAPSSGVPSGTWDTYWPDPAIGNGNNMAFCSCSE